MKVVILCGGRGTRLHEETEYRPKPMVPIGKWPILWHIMKIYSHYGHEDFILCLGYKGEMIKDYFRNYLWNTCDSTITLGRNPDIQFHNQHEEENWCVTLAETGEDSMTAFRIRLIKKHISEDTFMLTYGDGLGDINISALIDFHNQEGKICTVTGVNPPGRFGELRIDEQSTVTGFDEKPQAVGGYINGGFMVCDQRLFDYLPDDSSIMLEQAPMKKLVEDRQLAVFRHDGFWQPMDTFGEYKLLNQIWSGGNAPWKVW